MGKWLRLVDKNGNLKPHTLPEELLEDVKRDIEINHGEGRFDFVTEEVTKYSFDLGGCWIDGSPCVEMYVDGMPVDIPCYQWGGFITLLNSARARLPVAGINHTVFYKIHGHWTALVLSSHQRASLLMRLKDGAADADRRDELFMATWKARNATKT